MFKWLAKLLMNTPVQPSGCSCCEAKREHMEKLRRKIMYGEEIPEPESYHQEVREISQCACQEYTAIVLGSIIHGCYPILPNVSKEETPKE